MERDPTRADSQGARAPLVFRGALRHELLALARDGAPCEVSGRLVADEGGVVVAAELVHRGAVHEVALPDASDPRAGTFHSHPASGPMPSESDRLAMRPGEPMVIVSLETREVRAFVLADDRMHVRELVCRWRAGG